jgi:hypothetical protein
MATKYNVQLANAAKKMLDKQEFKYEFNESTGVISFGCGLGKDCKIQSVRLSVWIGDTAITSYGLPLLKADATTVDAVVEYITRANYGLRAGNFEFDYDDGEVRFKHHSRLENRIPSEDELDTLVFMPIYMWKRYGNGFMNVMFGGASPKSAIAEAEAD